MNNTRNIAISNVLLLVFSFFLVSCEMFSKNGVSRGEIVTKLKSSAKLATVEYVVTKVITAKQKRIIFKDKYFFAETEAYIKAGIDLNKLKEEDIEIEGTKIRIVLPPIEIINFSYPADSFKMVDKYTKNPGVFSREFSLEQREELFRKGEESIREDIKSLGIVETAQNNTRMLIEKILIASGFNEIYIEFRPNKELTNDFDAMEKDMESKDK